MLLRMVVALKQMGQVMGGLQRISKSGEQDVLSFHFKTLPPRLFDSRLESGRNNKTVPFSFLLTSGSDCPGPSSLHTHRLSPRLWDRTPCSGWGGASYLKASGRGGEKGMLGRVAAEGRRFRALSRHRREGAGPKLPRKTKQNRTQEAWSLSLHFPLPAPTPSRPSL